METEQIPAEDLIDKELSSIISGLVTDDSDEEEMDAAGDILFDIIEDAVEDGVIDDLPDYGDDDVVKQAWVDSNLEKLKATVIEALNDDLVEPEDADGDKNS